jgi:hypothetical protein
MRTSARAGNMANKAKAKTKTAPTGMRAGTAIMEAEGLMDFTAYMIVYFNSALRSATSSLIGSIHSSVSFFTLLTTRLTA